MFVLFRLAATATAFAQPSSHDPRVDQLAKEVRYKGWIVYSARTDKDDWDLFLIRPNGSSRRSITNTSEFSEMGGRFSSDGKRLLYRRLPKGSTFAHDKWGIQGQLIIANSDGTNPVIIGGMGEFPWASWSPDGKQIACLDKDGIKIYELATKKEVRRMDRKGIYQQFFWSPDGKWFCGPANQYGQGWGVVRMNINTGVVNSVSETKSCCTPDWFPDSRHIVYSYRPSNQEVIDNGEMARRAGQKLEHGWTQLWMADAEGKGSLVYGEDGCHIYGGAISPDSQYVLFTRSYEEDLKVMGMVAHPLGSKKRGAPMALMRLSDAPTIGGESKALRKLHPRTKDGPLLQLPECWEPHWTYADIGIKR